MIGIEEQKEDENNQHREGETQQGKLDYDPVHFLRCHSKKNDGSDVQTQVWQCAFEPDIKNKRKTTSLVATCGGNSICFIDVNTGIIPMKYYAKDLRELFYALAWTTNGEHTFLVSGGIRYTVHLIHPATGLAVFYKPINNSKNKKHISSLMFHPMHWNLLICGGSQGDIHICHIGDPCPPSYDVNFRILQCFSTKSEIFSMTYCPVNNMLLTGCDGGLLGWKFPDDIADTTESITFEPIKFTLPLRVKGGEQDLVDSVEAYENGIIATKCALHGAIYLWNLTETLTSTTRTVKPTHVLPWSQTDNYFMFIGVQPEAGLLCCGDDKGSLWIYDLHSLSAPELDSAAVVMPACLVLWPKLTDPYTEKKRKLPVDNHDIVVDKVAISSDRNHIVAVTNNNMVCIWKKV